MLSIRFFTIAAASAAASLLTGCVVAPVGGYYAGSGYYGGQGYYQTESVYVAPPPVVVAPTIGFFGVYGRGGYGRGYGGGYYGRPGWRR
ncbi:hypothetical protein [Paracidovorax valerianellae]|uniref:PXPV repeat-containing protein n=1 Tax=Paracidovorax valerianellae TaxID=187868 RepID=A0A1G6M3V6_9BURK|nr:hypothetical protein [Paracidovorax valerianellae]MDA8446094.1 hypothetical protein [Paracidovorax valerianellae]SDC50121.1 hypothetical protein SAMN05192589_102319 [Paracidovorax valerianellae]